jgi:thiosulfate/3-mercaptopyruvate sulfurtransferase
MSRTEVLVSTDWLAEHATDADVRIIEVDEDTEAYGVNHIAGSIAWHWSDDLHDRPRRELISRDQFRTLLTTSGVAPGTTVILYGGNNNWFAAYAYWALKYRGFENVKLLDGGRKKWEAEHRPQTTEVPSIAPADPGALGPERPELRAFRDDVLASITDAAHARVDVRSPAEFSGELVAPPHLPQEQAQVPGHIPGSANVPWALAAREDGSFKGDDELRELYGNVGVTPDKQVTAYCRIGERSSHTWFVLHELLDYPNVRNYDGSWTEYGSLVGVPVERSA